MKVFLSSHEIPARYHEYILFRAVGRSENSWEGGVVMYVVVETELELKDFQLGSARLVTFFPSAQNRKSAKNEPKFLFFLKGKMHKKAYEHIWLRFFQFLTDFHETFSKCLI